MPRRFLIPYLLLGILTLGAGLGVGLGLSEGPLTSTGGPSAVAVAKVAVPNDNEPQSTGTLKHFFENTWGPIPKGFASCGSTTRKARLVPLGSAAFKKAISEPDESCTWRESQG